MRHFPWNFRAIPQAFGHVETLSTAPMPGFPAVALDQFVYTPPARPGASPTFQAIRLVSGARMRLPIFAAAVRAGQLIMTLLGLHLKLRHEIYMTPFPGGCGLCRL
jgi:hypothetical protein